MTLALRAFAARADRGRRQVIIPAYTCYSVPAAVERAGLDAVPCDVDPASLSLDLDHFDRLISGRTLALVTANLFGIPNDLVELERRAKASGIYLLDDAAQALGAQLAGRPVGGFGDVGLFSFDKGKNISTMQGGALVARDGPLVEEISGQWERLPPAGMLATAATTAKLIPYSLLLRPSRYRHVHRMRFLRLGETRYETSYPESQMGSGLVGIADELLQVLGDVQKIRVANAVALRLALGDLQCIRFINAPAQSSPSYPRFPVRLSTRNSRDRLLQKLNGAGIGASSFYPAALVDIPQVARGMMNLGSRFSGAREVADTILTLPTHPFTPGDLPDRVRHAAASISAM
jgi:dTDP-4-amino-4,6-dideoxygalactose transaminase